MSEKADPAVATAHQAAAQLRVLPQNRPQRDLILTNKRPGRIVPVPVGEKLVNLFQAYEKKARFCVIMRIVFSMSSSYRFDAKSSRGRARIFCALAQEMQTLAPAIGPRIIPYAFLLLRLINSASPARIPELKRLLGKRMGMTRVDRKPNHFFFQVAGGSKQSNAGGIQLSVIVESPATARRRQVG